MIYKSIYQKAEDGQFKVCQVIENRQLGRPRKALQFKDQELAAKVNKIGIASKRRRTIKQQGNIALALDNS